MIELQKALKKKNRKYLYKIVINGRLSHMLTAAWKSDEAFFVLLFSSRLSRSPFHPVVFPAT